MLVRTLRGVVNIILLEEKEEKKTVKIFFFDFCIQFVKNSH